MLAASPFTLTNRMWWAIAAVLPETEPGDEVWAKVARLVHGKRHALTTLPLTLPETSTIALLPQPEGGYFTFCWRHEAETNPACPWRWTHGPR